MPCLLLNAMSQRHLLAPQAFYLPQVKRWGKLGGGKRVCKLGVNIGGCKLGGEHWGVITGGGCENGGGGFVNGGGGCVNGGGGKPRGGKLGAVVVKTVK